MLIVHNDMDIIGELGTFGFDDTDVAAYNLALTEDIRFKRNVYKRLAEQAKKRLKVSRKRQRIARRLSRGK